MRKTKHITVENLGIPLEGHGRWLELDYIETEGATLYECLEKAVVWTVDQDGGSGPEYALNDLNTRLYAQLEALVAQAYLTKIGA